MIGPMSHVSFAFWSPCVVVWSSRCGDMQRDKRGELHDRFDSGDGPLRAGGRGPMHCASTHPSHHTLHPSPTCFLALPSNKLPSPANLPIEHEHEHQPFAFACACTSIILPLAKKPRAEPQFVGEPAAVGVASPHGISYHRITSASLRVENRNRTALRDISAVHLLFPSGTRPATRIPRTSAVKDTDLLPAPFSRFPEIRLRTGGRLSETLHGPK
jgi:hypothetical protein